MEKNICLIGGKCDSPKMTLLELLEYEYQLREKELKDKSKSTKRSS